MTRINFTGRMVILFFAILIFTAGSASAQNSARAEKMRQLIDSKHYIFKADIALPNGGSSRQLNPGEYNVSVMRDTLVTFLPYFGRIYTASLDTDPGIKLNSTDFTYSVKAKRKNRWQVIITPKNAKEVSSLLFDISDNGEATLLVNSVDRQPVSFSGYVVELGKN